jgi:membrane protease subunit HflC
MTGRLTAILIAAVLFLGSFAVFTVNEAERAVKFRLGEIVRTDYTPGLYFQTPFVNNVLKFDARVQTLDAKPQQYLTAEKKNVIVDSFVKWRIGDVGRYYTTMGGDVFRANQRLFQIADKQLRDEFGKRNIQDVVSGERAEIMKILTDNTTTKAKEFGIDIVDVRVKRVELPREVSDSVFSRMRAERSRVAKEFRARGQAEATRIRAEADRNYTVTVAEAYRDSQKIRGEGDARAAEIYARAYDKNREFYSLYRSLDAYKNIFRQQDDVIIFEPDSDFFKYFKKSAPK